MMVAKVAVAPTDSERLDDASEVDDLTLDDVLTGLFAALAERGYQTISLRGNHFDRALCEATRALNARSAMHNVNLRFRLSLGHDGESRSLREALARAAQRDVIGLDNPEYQKVRLGRWITRLLDGHALPGGKDLYTDLADDVLRSYEGEGSLVHQ